MKIKSKYLVLVFTLLFSTGLLATSSIALYSESDSRFLGSGLFEELSMSSPQGVESLEDLLKTVAERENASIKKLVLLAHGNSDKANMYIEVGQDLLQIPFHYPSDDACSEILAKTVPALNSIGSKLANNATLVFYSCLLLAGDTELQRKKAKALASPLNLRDGYILGFSDVIEPNTLLSRIVRGLVWMPIFMFPVAANNYLKNEIGLFRLCCSASLPLLFWKVATSIAPWGISPLTAIQIKDGEVEAINPLQRSELAAFLDRCDGQYSL